MADGSRSLCCPRFLNGIDSPTDGAELCGTHLSVEGDGYAISSNITVNDLNSMISKLSK